MTHTRTVSITSHTLHLTCAVARASTLAPASYHVSLRGLAILAVTQSVAIALLPINVALPSAVAELDVRAALPLLLANVVCFFTYNQMSFVVLSRVHVLTHAVANGFRRVVTIVFAVLYFGTPVKPINAAGMATVCRMSVPIAIL